MGNIIKKSVDIFKVNTVEKQNTIVDKIGDKLPKYMVGDEIELAIVGLRQLL